ncbi:hypothetical protein CHUAL_003965 [Chamberlinius hualienensis]
MLSSLVMLCLLIKVSQMTEIHDQADKNKNDTQFNSTTNKRQPLNKDDPSGHDKRAAFSHVTSSLQSIYFVLPRICVVQPYNPIPRRPWVVMVGPK